MMESYSISEKNSSQLVDQNNKIEIETSTKNLQSSYRNKYTENENKQNSSTLFRIRETQKVKNNYLNALMINEVSKQNQVFRPMFLQNHKVTSEVRVRMVLTFIYLY